MQNLEKPYATSLKAVVALGVSKTVVEDDIIAGMAGHIRSLIGGRDGDYWFVESFELEEPRLSIHRKRLADYRFPDPGVT